jgi:bifunctional non-homologous end joining protein LigD
MAIHVEDHPLSYANFEGTIPEGNYGAGTVIVWDTGEWIPLGDPAAGYAGGRLKFELRGEKLRGHWNLIRTHLRSGDKDSWLLIKERDEEARPAAEFDITEAQPASVLRGAAPAGKTAAKKSTSAKKAAVKKSATAKEIAAPQPELGVSAEQPLMLAPQLATLVDKAPRETGWLYEIKFDGYRVLARINANDGIHLFTRNGNDWTKKLKHLAAALAKLNLGEAWLDGEIVVLDNKGISNFQQLQNAFESAKTEKITYLLFDIPFYRGRDLRAVPLIERRKLLQQLLSANNESTNALIRFSEHIDAPPAELLDTACRMQVEGLIGKRINAPYTSNRTRDWIKLKCMQRQEFVIGGYTDASNVNVRAIGALLLGVHDNKGNLRYVGKVGTGFTQQSSIDLHSKLQPLITEKSPFADTVRQPGVHWVKPSLLAEVAFGAWTDDGHIRHSAFQGLRSDKPAAAITRELPQKVDAVAAASKPAAALKSRAAKKSTAAATRGSMRSTNRDSEKAVIAGITITHPDRVIDKTSGITKYQLVQYYERVAPQLLAHLKNRPVSLVRAPEGVGGEIFFQKHVGGLHIPELFELDPALMPKHPPLIAVNSLTALIGSVQMNVVEFHSWNTNISHSEQPDRMVFDLDPGEGIVWNQIVEAAALLKSMLDALQLKSFLKTSGGKGLHVVVPLAPQDDWATVRNFSEALVRHLAAAIPQLFVAVSGPKNRVNRIFIDYLRNNRGSTTAAAFSARLRPGLGVSIPLAWDELSSLQSSMQWTVDNVDAAIAAEREQTWKGYAKVRQTLQRAQRKLDSTK